jgi:hypothetical protein
MRDPSDQRRARADEDPAAARDKGLEPLLVTRFDEVEVLLYVVVELG